MRIPSWRSAVLGGSLCVLLGGCATVVSPSREGSLSDRVVFACLSKDVPTSSMQTVLVAGSTARGQQGRQRLAESAWLPERTVEFDIDRDQQAVFVFVLRTPKDPEQQRTRLLIKVTDPLARTDERIDTIDFDQRGRQAGAFWNAVSIPMSVLKLAPGSWKVDLFADGEPMGTYPFFVGDSEMIAAIRAKQ